MKKYFPWFVLLGLTAGCARVFPAGPTSFPTETERTMQPVGDQGAYILTGGKQAWLVTDSLTYPFTRKKVLKR